MTEERGHQVLLTHEQVDRWKKELEKINLDIANLLDRQQFLTTKLKAVDDLLQPEKLPLEQVSASVNVNSIRARQILKRFRPVFKNLEGDFVQGSIQLETTISEEDGESMVEAVSRILEEARCPLSNDEIRSQLSLIPKFADSLQAGPNYYYTVMSRLVSRGQALKTGKYYMAPSVIGVSSGRTEEDQDQDD